ncbi:MBL fold metallo-hydrolase [Saccharopolyspora sp. K220]|uniref:MBL fold metallo-hydrolase n=1 Tax=Saccharopolyspora soli TaxID=2926618 RepID=UPI001F59919A|nr:MBL fold metallo-hydrolase [Saccharopolyspora soli]MCI2417456.1 MBL fold metallo-hydrolase [Saccharopolyspora soli]
MCASCDAPANEPNRRSVLRTTMAAGVAGIAALTAGCAPAAPAAAPGGPSGVHLRWLGLAGWEITFDGHHLLVDPYFTRQQYAGPDGKMDADRPLEVNARIIDWVLDEHLRTAPEFILTTHGHWDHLADIAPLLNHPRWRDQRIRVLGGETHLNLIRAMDAPPSREADLVLVTGGENLRYPLRSPEQPRPAYTIEVFRSLHSQLGGYGFAPAGTLTAPPKTPTTLGELVEGGTLGYQVTVGDRLRVMFLSGTANFAEREVAGATPDVLVLGASGNAAVHDYFERVLATLGWPRVVIPSHHDDMVTQLDRPEVHDTVNREIVATLQEVLGDRGRVLDPRHLQHFEL